MSKETKTTPYEQAIAAICFGVFFIGIGVFMMITSSDLGQPMGRIGLPGWAIVGLLWISGLGALITGLVKLLRGVRP